MARLRDITGDLRSRLEHIERRRREEEDRHKQALEGLDRQLREEKERHQDMLDVIERDREMVREVVDRAAISRREPGQGSRAAAHKRNPGEDAGSTRN